MTVQLKSEPILTLRGRRIFHIEGTEPAVWLLDDQELGGVLINAPPFSETLLEAIQQQTRLAYLFLPSRHGAQDLAAWQQAGAEILAFEAEAPAITAAGGVVDIAFNRKQRLARTIDFLPMAGITEGSCALRLKNLPGVIFFGPILAPGDNGWPTLQSTPAEHSWESRLFGVLGLQDLKYAYAFCDVFTPGWTQIGPDADAQIQRNLQAVLDS